MKRFWKEVTFCRREGGWTIELDGKPVRTPARALLQLPTEELARAIAGEWRAVEDRIDPRAMPLTGLANAAIDRIAPDRSSFAAGLARYAEADLACYRAEGPRELVVRQEKSWDFLLGWARRHFDIDFATTSGILHVPQPEATVNRLAHAIAALRPFQLAGLSPLVTIGGSLLVALAVLEKAIEPSRAWEIVTLDEQWQLEKWGSDAVLEVTLGNRKRDFLAAAEFLDLVGE